MNNQFDIYLKELIEWNKKFNLTSITDPAEIRIKHFEDSLTLLQFVPLTDQSVIDIGAGAGFPGIPLKIVCPGIKLTLLEATRKKADFLRHIVSLLNLKDVEVIWGRAEELVKDKKGKFDIALARAVAKMDVLSGWCLPFVKSGGLFVAYKGEKVEDEVKAAEKAIAKQRGTVKMIEKVKLPGSDIVHSLVLIEKAAR